MASHAPKQAHQAATGTPASGAQESDRLAVRFHTSAAGMVEIQDALDNPPEPNEAWERTLARRKALTGR